MQSHPGESIQQIFRGAQEYASLVSVCAHTFTHAHTQCDQSNRSFSQESYSMSLDPVVLYVDTNFSYRLPSNCYFLPSALSTKVSVACRRCLQYSQSILSPPIWFRRKAFINYLLKSYQNSLLETHPLDRIKKDIRVSVNSFISLQFWVFDKVKTKFWLCLRRSSFFTITEKILVC